MLAGAAGTRGITIGGTNLNPCNDMIVNGARTPDLPYKGIKIMFAQGNLWEQVAKVDADAKFAFIVEVSLPAKAASGYARFVVDHVSRQVEFDLKMDPVELQIVPRVQTSR